MRIIQTIFLLVLANIFSGIILADVNDQEIPAAIIDANTAPTESVITNDTIIVISQKQITQSGAVNITQVLRNQAGIQLNDLFGDNSQVSVSMRGFGENAANNSLLLIDGFPLTKPDTAAPQLNSIPIQEIERIEIIPGSPAVLYGDQAVGGIINIITRQPLKFTTELLGVIGSYDNTLGNIFLGDSLMNGFNYNLDGEINGTKNYREHNNQNRENLFTKFGYRYQTGSIMFRLQRFHDFLQFPGALTATQIAINPQQAENTNDFSDELFQQYQAQLKQTITPNWLLQINLSHNNTLDDGIIFSHFFQQRDVNLFNPRIIGSIENSILTSGIDIEDDQYKFNSDFLHDDDSLRQYGLYTQLLLPIASKFQGTLGARDEEQFTHLDNALTKQNTGNQAFVAEASLSYLINPAWRLYISREGNFRFPKVDENAFIPANATPLKTQTGVSYETGMEWLYADRELKLTLYQLNLQNEIAFDPLPSALQPFGSNVNLSATRRNGLILSFRSPITAQLSMGLDYGYVNAFFLQGPYDGNEIPFVAKNIVNLNANYNFLPHWNLYFEELYTGNRYASADFQNTNGKIAGYALSNVNLQYQRQHWVLSARINNLFNKKYNSFIVFNPAMNQNAFYPAPGIAFLVTGEYQL